MDGYYNATVILRQPLDGTAGDADLRREHGWHEHPEQRCSLRQTTMQQEATVLGGLAVGAYTMRLHCAVPILAGWECRVRRDGEDSWHTYMVRRGGQVGVAAMQSLLLERVGG